MDDKNFLDVINRELENLHEKRVGMEKDAEIALEFMKSFRKKVFQYLEEHNDAKIVRIEHKDILQHTCNYDMRQYMDDDFINELAVKGYVYINEKSSKDSIVLKRIEDNRELL